MKHPSPAPTARAKVPAAESAVRSAALRQQPAVPAFQRMAMLVLAPPQQVADRGALQPVTAGGPPVQRTVTQILPGQGNKISKLSIVGRPDRVFSNSMGDHTTAFATHIEAIKLKMEGKTLKEALAGIAELHSEALKLPGYSLKDNLPKDEGFAFGSARAHGSRLEAAETTLLADIKTATGQQDGDQTEFALTLQECVNTYLEFRELIPLSTINVLSVAPAQAGKGKGESGHASVLAVNERSDTAGSKETIREAMLGTFDVYAAALVVASTDPVVLTKLAPGLDPKTAIAKRSTMLALQHIQSMASEFPKSLKDSGLEVKDLDTIIFDAAKEKLATDGAYFKKKVGEWTETLEVVKGGISSGVNKTKYYKDYRDKLIRDIGEYEDRLKLVNEALKDSEEVEIPDTEVDVPTEKEKAEETAKAEEREEKALEKEERKHTIATQVVLKPVEGEEAKIGQLKIAGRPPSPLSGTMGAHTTAWVLHVDRVSQALEGKTISNAWITISDVLVPEAEKLATTLQKASPDVTRSHEGLAAQALKTLKLRQAKKPKDFKSASELAFTLQQYINELFTYINYIPGVTREAGNTDGRGEAKHRRYLRGFETMMERADEKRKRTKPRPGRRKLTNSEHDEIGVAVRGLLDLTDLDTRGPYREAHNDIIGNLYPKTWFAYINHGSLFI